MQKKKVFHIQFLASSVAQVDVVATQILHRHFFARAMLDKKQSPFEGPYASSVLATYRSAIILQSLFSKAAELFPAHSLRMHDMWSMSLICGVRSSAFFSHGSHDDFSLQFIIGAVACQGFSKEIAKAAMSELDKTILTFESGPDHPTPKRGLVSPIFHL